MLLLLFLFSSVSAIDIVQLACQRNSSLSYCKDRQIDVRRAVPKAPEDPFNEGKKEDEDISLETEEEETTTRRFRSTTPVPIPRQNILYTIFPTFQKEKDYRKYCPVNQYTFQVTCLPGKKLRYDLQEFSDMCGVPNTNLFPSRTGREDDGRPKGYGQKQENGNLGLGRSFGFGFGAIPGFEVTASHGADIGNKNLPFFNQIGGMMFNQGTRVGALGHRYGNGPARSMNALSHGYPNLGFGKEPNNGDKKLSQEVLKSFGIPNLPGLNKVFSKLGGNRPKYFKGFEPGYGAVNPNAPFAIGKVRDLRLLFSLQTDRDALNLPGGFGDVEIEKGAGMGIGK